MIRRRRRIRRLFRTSHLVLLSALENLSSVVSKEFYQTNSLAKKSSAFIGRVRSRISNNELSRSLADLAFLLLRFLDYRQNFLVAISLAALAAASSASDMPADVPRPAGH